MDFLVPYDTNMEKEIELMLELLTLVLIDS